LFELYKTHEYSVHVKFREYFLILKQVVSIVTTVLRVYGRCNNFYFDLGTRDYKQSTRRRYNKRNAFSKREPYCHKMGHTVTKWVILSQNGSYCHKMGHTVTK